MKPGTWIIVTLKDDNHARQYEATIVDMATPTVPGRIRIQNDVEKQGSLRYPYQYQVSRVLGELELAE